MFRLLVETPQNLTKRQRELLAEFEKLSSGRPSRKPRVSFAKVKDFFGRAQRGR